MSIMCIITQRREHGGVVGGEGFIQLVMCGAGFMVLEKFREMSPTYIVV